MIQGEDSKSHFALDCCRHQPAVPETILFQSGGKVLADDFSLQERGISQLAEWIALPQSMSSSTISAGHKTLWDDKPRKP
jgi:hypothetical protein